MELICRLYAHFPIQLLSSRRCLSEFSYSLGRETCVENVVLLVSQPAEAETIAVTTGGSQ